MNEQLTNYIKTQSVDRVTIMVATIAEMQSVISALETAKTAFESASMDGEPATWDMACDAVRSARSTVQDSNWGLTLLDVTTFD